MSKNKDPKRSDSEEISDVSSRDETCIINIEHISPEHDFKSSLTLFPLYLLQEMQSALPPDQVRELLTEQAEMLDQMVSDLTSGKVHDSKSFSFHKEEALDQLRDDVSKRVNELEQEQQEIMKITAGFNQSQEIQEDLAGLHEELLAVKKREQSTYALLQKAHSRIRLMECELLQAQRKYYFELEKISFENMDLRRKLEASEFDNVRTRQRRVLNENNFLKNEVSYLKSQIEDLNSNKVNYLRTGWKDERNERNEIRHKRMASEDDGGFYSAGWKNRSNEVLLKGLGKGMDLRDQVAKTPEKRIQRNFNMEDLQENLALLQGEFKNLNLELRKVDGIRGNQQLKRKKELEIEVVMCENKINSIMSRIKRIESLAGS